MKKEEEKWGGWWGGGGWKQRVPHLWVEVVSHAVHAVHLPFGVGDEQEAVPHRLLPDKILLVAGLAPAPLPPAHSIPQSQHENNGAAPRTRES